MADNLFALLKGAHDTAAAAEALILGVEVGIVTNVKDPEKLGRVKLCLPRLPGKPETSWARVVQPAAGPGRGFYWLPHVHDEVLVAFERGASSKPFVIGSLWNSKDKPMSEAPTDENTRVMLQSASGHQLLLDDKDGEEKVVIADKSGKRSVTFDVKAQKFLVEAAEGDVVLKAAKKIVLECEEIEIKTAKTGKIEIGAKFDLVIKDKGQLKAGPLIEMKASRIDLNEGGGGGGGGGAGAGGRKGGGAAGGKRGAAGGGKGGAGAGGKGGASAGGKHGAGAGGNGAGAGGKHGAGAGAGHHQGGDLARDSAPGGKGGKGGKGAGKDAKGKDAHDAKGKDAHDAKAKDAHDAKGKDAHEAKAKNAGADKAGKPKQPEKGKVTNLRWGRDSFKGGDELVMTADAPGLDGRKVRFLVQHSGATGAWKQIAETTATVASGAVTGKVRVDHPQEGSPGASHRSLRFKCELLP